MDLIKDKTSKTNIISQNEKKLTAEGYKRRFLKLGRVHRLTFIEDQVPLSKKRAS